jgi:D-3-phosphoglycerate dehydrogenase
MHNKPCCIYFSCLDYDSSNIKLIRENFNPIIFESPFDDWQKDSRRGEVEAIFCPLQGEFNSCTLKDFGSLRVLMSNTTSIPHIDRSFAAERGINICALHDEEEFLQTITPTSEFTIGLIVLACRNVLESQKSVLNGQWNRKDWGGIKMLSRSSLGIIGLGRIGMHVARAASAMGMRIYWYDPYLSEYSQNIQKDLIRCSSLHQIASNSDIITLHAKLDEDNRHMIDDNFFNSIEKAEGSIFINTARGELVSNQALLSALMNGKIRFAALDTIDGEFKKGFISRLESHPLVEYAKSNTNLLITPHIAGSTSDAWRYTERRVILKGIDYLQMHAA